MSWTEALLVFLLLGLYVVNFRNRKVTTVEHARTPVEAPAADETQVEGDAARSQPTKDTAHWLEQFKAEEDPWLAHILIRRAFIESPSNGEVFRTYVDYLLARADSADGTGTKLDFLADGYGAVVSFSESCGRTDFALVAHYRGKIETMRAQYTEQQTTALRDQNEEVIGKLKETLASIQKCDEAGDIRSHLEQAAILELGLNLPTLSEEQKDTYARLKKSYEEHALRTAAQLKQAQIAEYNRQAVTKIKALYDAVQAGEQTFIGKLWKKIEIDRVALVKQHVSTINIAYLSPEVLTYFNHVYGYIFSKLTDQEKFTVTEVMTLAEKDVLDTL